MFSSNTFLYDKCIFVVPSKYRLSGSLGWKIECWTAKYHITFHRKQSFYQGTNFYDWKDNLLYHLILFDRFNGFLEIVFPWWLHASRNCCFRYILKLVPEIYHEWYMSIGNYHYAEYGINPPVTLSWLPYGYFRN